MARVRLSWVNLNISLQYMCIHTPFLILLYHYQCHLTGFSRIYHKPVFVPWRRGCFLDAAVKESTTTFSPRTTLVSCNYLSSCLEESRFLMLICNLAHFSLAFRQSLDRWIIEMFILRFKKWNTYSRASCSHNFSLLLSPVCTFKLLNFL